MEINVARLIGAVTREVSTREFNGKPARVLVASRAYGTTVDDLWDALTNPERIPRWFLPISGDLRPGGRYQLKGNAGGSILECEPQQHLAVTWEFGGEESWVDVRIGKNPAGATLRLEHIAHVPEEFWEQYGPGATGVGWEQAFFGLELHLQKMKAEIEPKEIEAWLLSEDGKSFTSKLSEAWCRASIASGAEASAARARARRTTEFYSG